VGPNALPNILLGRDVTVEQAQKYYKSQVTDASKYYSPLTNVCYTSHPKENSNRKAKALMASVAFHFLGRNTTSGRP